MGFLRPKIPAAATPKLEPAPTSDDRRVQQAAENAARAAANRRDLSETILTQPRRTGGLATRLRQTIGA